MAKFLVVRSEVWWNRIFDWDVAVFLFGKCFINFDSSAFLSLSFDVVSRVLPGAFTVYLACFG